MLHILILILEILGILLAVSAGIFLFLLLALIFLPFCYRIETAGRLEEKREFRAELRVVWLCFILKGVYPSLKKGIRWRIQLGCFPLYDSAGRKVGNRRRRKAEGGPAPRAGNKRDGEEAAERKEDGDERPSPGSFEEAGSSSAPPKPRETAAESKVMDRLLAFRGKMEYTIGGIYDKIKKIIENIRYYIDVIRGDTFRAAFALSKEELARVLRMICPKKWEMQMTAGTGEPSSTGQMMAAYGILYPRIGSHVILQPDFEKRVLEGRGYLRGRVTVFILLVAALRLYRDRNLRQLLRLLKKEET